MEKKSVHIGLTALDINALERVASWRDLDLQDTGVIAGIFRAALQYYVDAVSVGTWVVSKYKGQDLRAWVQEVEEHLGRELAEAVPNEIRHLQQELLRRLESLREEIPWLET